MIYTLALMFFSWSVPIDNSWFGQHYSFLQGSGDSLATVIDAITHSVLAGVSEELINTVIPILLRAVNISRKSLVPLLLIERVLFHVYFGPGSVTVLIWAGLSILLYRYTQSALGLVLPRPIHRVGPDYLPPAGAPQPR